MDGKAMDKTIRVMQKKMESPLRPIFLPPWGFKDTGEEALYMAYTLHQRQRVIPRLLVMAALMQVFSVIVPGERDLLPAYIIVAVYSVLNLILAALYIWARCTRTALNFCIWLVIWSDILVSASRRCGDSYNEMLGWAVFFQYFTVATIPLHYFVLTMYSIMSITSYLVFQYYNAYTSGYPVPEDFYLQQIASGSLLFAATLLGATAYTANEKQQRRSFQQTKNSLRDKLTIEQQSKEQERLLLSVLPEHVAVQMRKDLGLIDTQFKKIYMSRHENVSILYADIVGFTAISSTYSAQDLVAILNELFARFDRLAEMYQQLRIKILGDCYYCISGAPVERPDHAILCVHMGLSMVKAIKYVQQTTNSPVDMRVGIHTGAVLAGVLGQRQWQFDVYSRDVELANKMESSGMAGRVHVSEVTLGFLNNEFEVEPAYGERREEMLRQAGIKTYFIVRVLKKGAVGDAAADALSDLRDDDESSVLSPQDDIKDNQGEKILSMLREELVQRDDDKELADTTTLCMKFKLPEEERGYMRRKDPCMLAVALPCLFLLPTVTVLASFATPPTLGLNSAYIAYMLEAGLVNIIYYSVFRYAQYKKKRLSPYWKITCGLLNTSMFLAINITPLFLCGHFEEVLLDEGVPEEELPFDGMRRCMHPSYYYHLGAATACTAAWVPLGWAARAALALAAAGAHALPALAFPALLRPRPFLDHNPYHEPYNATTDYNKDLFTILSHIHNYRNIIMLFLIAIAVLIVNRFTESLERARHVRGQRMRAQAEQARDLRRRNQALVHNVLPPHVATHFMGARHHHRDLYSQSYAEVGVLFASMPNFSEFYSEETVNNQGLECLRFLNEVISDFDMLLEEAKFKDIIKIKTISSTYMAASGLNPKRLMQPSDGVLVRWAHLACLVDFALELQRVLAAINEQSFNHFVLRMGVNHGPITAGVIGARKPHYDIWGNTVNVASRMESTGKAGCIQVTEETCEILQNFGYYFEQRGLVAVKGKGQLMTYYLQGQRDPPTGAGAADQHTLEEGSLEAGAGVRDALLATGAAADSSRTGVDADAAAADPLLQH